MLSPFLSFLIFWRNLNKSVALYNGSKFHDEWTSRNGPKLLENTIYSFTPIKGSKHFSLACDITFLEVWGFVPTAAKSM